MELSTTQNSVQQNSVQEPTTRKRVRNWRKRLPQPQISVATFNNLANVAADNSPEPKIKRSEILAMNEQTLSESNVQNSTKLSNMAISKNSNQDFPGSKNQGSPKSNEENNNQSSPKPNDQVSPANIGNQGSPKANVRVLSPVTREVSPKNDEKIFLSKSNKISQGAKNKRRRNKGSSKKDNTENQHNSHNVSDNASKAESSMNDQKIVTDTKKDDRDKHVENQPDLVDKIEEIEADPSSNGQHISVNNQISLLEKHENIDNKEPESATIDEDNKHTHTNVTAVKSGAEQQITKDRFISVTEGHVQSTRSNSLSFVRARNKKTIEETNSSVAQDPSVEDKKENVQESQQESQLDFVIVKKTDKKADLVSSNELSSKAEEESNATIDEANPSEITTFVKRYMELKMTDNEKDVQEERIEIPAEKVENAEPQNNAKRGLPAGCLFVASLPSTKSDGDLQKSVWNHFSRWGILLNVKVLKDWLFRPYSFVQFENVCDAKKALVEAHNTVIEGRHIRVEQARVNRTLFIGRLNRTMNEEDIRKLLEPYGAAEDIYLLRTYSTGRSRGCAFVKFCYRDDAIRAYMNLRQHTSNYVIEWAANLEKAVPGPEDIDKKSIFVGQLNQAEVTKESLAEKFGRYGRIKEIQYVARKFLRASGSPRSAFAFIYYDDEEAPRKAIEAENNTKYFDRTIRVQYRESQEFRHQQIQLLRQQQEIRRKAFQESYYNVIPSGRQPIRPPPLSRAQNYYASVQKTSISQGRRNSIIPKEIPIMTTPVFYPQVSMGVHQIGPNKNTMSGSNTNGKQEPKGKGPEVQNNTAPKMIQPELMYYPPPTSIPTSVGMISAYTGSPREFTMPPYIHTPEGLAYPYASSMTFMGTINHNNGASSGHEPKNTTTSKAPLAPNILHSYIPPYVPGQPINEYGFSEVVGHSTQYCGVPIPIQITMPPPMYFYPSPPMDPGYKTPYLQTLEDYASGYEAVIEINTHTDEKKTAVGEITKEEGSSSSKVLDNKVYADVAQEPLKI
ncbi:Rim4p [Rhizophagus irregularis DAOM 197198w]|uniref:Rim4p n=3 Tax=Rhizophagus irregularis TaxID=588596 RepID=A0A015JSW8_RHIIW|nr:Rim4p [Rhizophagus irregularis DAOM 197198w]